jgi:hypothetical protein
VVSSGEGETMSRKTTSGRDRRAFAPRRKAQIAVAVTVVVSLFAAWTMLASSGALDRVFSQKAEKKGPVSLASFTSASKEYIYAGGRLVATEEPSSSGNLAKPANFKATADTEGLITTRWDDVAAATKYEVWRGNTINGSFARITQPDTTATSYTDSSVPFNSNSSSVTTYLYKVPRSRQQRQHVSFQRSRSGYGNHLDR